MPHDISPQDVKYREFWGNESNPQDRRNALIEQRLEDETNLPHYRGQSCRMLDLGLSVDSAQSSSEDYFTWALLTELFPVFHFPELKQVER